MVAILAFAMVFCIGSAPFAYENNDSIYTVVAPATSTSVTVSLDLQSNNVNGSNLNLDYDSFDVTITSFSATNFTVQDVINQWRANNTSYTLKSVDYTSYPYQIVDFENDDPYIYSITKNGVTYSPSSTSDLYGWNFKVNAKIPIQPNGYGATIATTYVEDGDVVDLYFDNPTSATNATKFTRINASNNGSTLNVNVQETHQWYDASWNWYSPSYTNFQGGSVTVKNSAGTTIGSGTTDSNGNFAINNLTSGTYEIYVNSSFNGQFLANTGAYAEFLLQ